MVIYIWKPVKNSLSIGQRGSNPIKRASADLEWAKFFTGTPHTCFGTPAQNRIACSTYRFLDTTIPPLSLVS
jgi:hypothetical protein